MCRLVTVQHKTKGGDPGAEGFGKDGHSGCCDPESECESQIFLLYFVMGGDSLIMKSCERVIALWVWKTISSTVCR